MVTMTRSIDISPELADYLAAHSTQPTPAQADLHAATAALGPVSGMQIGADQGTMLGLLIHAIQPELVVEVGTFTGYSSLAMALRLPENARLLCCDVSEKWTALAKQAWEAANVASKIDLRIAPAIETLRSIPEEPSIGFAFVDADKTGYIAYYEEILPRLTTNGLLAIDNTIWSGRVIDQDDTDPDTEAIRAFNAHVANDPRSEQVMLTIGDGVTLLRRR